MPQEPTPPTLAEIVDQIESLLDDAAAGRASGEAGHISSVLTALQQSANTRRLGISHRLAGRIVYCVDYEQAAERYMADARELLAK